MIMMHVQQCRSTYLAAMVPFWSAATVTCPASQGSARLALVSGTQQSCVCAASRQNARFAANRSETAPDVVTESERRQDHTATTPGADASVDTEKDSSPAGMAQQEQQSGQTPAPLWHVPWDDWWAVLIAAVIGSPDPANAVAR